MLIQGATWIRKTRLLAAARAEAGALGIRVLGTRGSELERDFASAVVR